ncbi:MAG: recombinase family protein [Clostridiales bacterium]|jgi:site-specific DNA recombinase|nr:recombinase family protein [Clostridiales bacterium]
MIFGVYSRKSKFTGKGESVENQIQLCKEYIERHFGDIEQHSIEVFEDEGFSGKNTDRPEFQRMLALAHKRQLDYVVCYRLDRISRNVSDFSTLIEDFAHNKVSFICIKERFDTSTPMGRAMMYIASVFAQLERETIAERIRDNMMLLARTGRWLGGNTPLGYKSAKVSKEIIEGKAKSSFILEAVDSELDTVRLIYTQYLTLRSLTKVETYLVQHGAKTRIDNFFTTVTLRDILTNPVYCKADQDALRYFEECQADVCYENDGKEYDGLYGISAYNRTANEGKVQIKNDISHWIITVGKHKGIISGKDWVQIQRIIKTNMPKKYGGKVQNQASLLSGLLVCKQCGSFMRPRVNSNKQRDENGNKPFAYLCELKKKSKGHNCQTPNINGNELDKAVCEEILKYDESGSLINAKLQQLKQSLTNTGSVSQISLNNVRSQIKERKAQIDDCLNLLVRSQGKESKLYEYTEKKIEELDKELTGLQKEEFKLIQEVELSDNYGNQIDIIYDALKSFASTFYVASASDKRAFLRSIIEKIEWDGKNIHIFPFGESPK